MAACMICVFASSVLNMRLVRVMLTFEPNAPEKIGTTSSERPVAYVRD
jgi:hypothetical protein